MENNERTNTTLLVNSEIHYQLKIDAVEKRISLLDLVNKILLEYLRKEGKDIDIKL